jgi:hypothetical protein
MMYSEMEQEFLPRSDVSLAVILWIEQKNGIYLNWDIIHVKWSL